MTGRTDYPHWPAGLSDQTPLPFALWRVMDAVNGRTSHERLAVQLGLSVPQLLAALDAAEALVSRAERRERPASEDMLRALAQALIAVVGPVGSLVLDDVRDEVGESASLPRLIEAITLQLDEAQRQPFQRQLQTRGVA